MILKSRLGYSAHSSTNFYREGVKNVRRFTKWSITQPRVVRFRLHLVLSVITWYSIYNKRSRSKGQRSRLQRDITRHGTLDRSPQIDFVDVNASVITAEPNIRKCPPTHSVISFSNGVNTVECVHASVCLCVFLFVSRSWWHSEFPAATLSSSESRPVQ